MGKRTGLGKTGETYLVGTDKLMRSNSSKDPEHFSIKASFADPERGKVDTESCTNAWPLSDPDAGSPKFPLLMALSER